MTGKLTKKWLGILSRIPGYDPVATAGDCHFDAKVAQRCLDFFEHPTDHCLRHVKGALAGQPFKLQPWERAIVANAFGWMRPDGTRRYREVFIFVARKNGKALALDTPIPTPDGWLTMGELEVGMTVFDEKGRPVTVTYVSPVMSDHECYRVTFSDDESIVADADHLWQTTTRKPYGKTGLWTTKDIAATLTIGTRPGVLERNHRIPVPKPLQLIERDLPVPPYVLGVWLGDGHSGSSALTFCEDEIEMLEELAANGVELRRRNSKAKGKAVTAGMVRKNNQLCRRGHLLGIHVSRGRKTPRCLACERETDYARRHGLPVPGVTNVTFQETLRKVGVLGNKHIPNVYLRASITQRLDLLRGLMDTDGYCSKRGQCEFSTTSEKLRDGFLELARSLGYKPTLKTTRATLYGRDCGPSYRIQFCAFSDMPVFLLRRKAGRQRTIPATITRSQTRHIISVERTESVPVRCIQVDSSSHLYLAGKGMIPTHNTSLAAGLVNLVLFTDDEPGMEIYSAAADRDQASLVFDVTKGMVLQDEELRSRSQVYVKAITVEAQSSVYRAISSDANTKHGYNVHFCVIDELHAHKNRDLVDVLMTATGSRRQPMIVHITTAGSDRNSICYEKYSYACKVRDGIVPDAAFLPVIYEANPKSDWTLPETWKDANPNLGVSLSLDEMKRACKKAQEIPAEENLFKRLHLNIWTEQITRWLAMDAWDACNLHPIDEESLRGAPCVIGLDLSSTKDITAVIAAFQDDEGGYEVIPRFFVPEDSIRERARRDRVPYDVWAEQGLITATPGNVVDYDRVRAEINAMGDKFQVREVAFDPWAATQIATQLGGDGFTVIAFRQGFASMSAPSKELEKLVLGRKLNHGGNPVLRWMASNVAAEIDAAGNVKPSKKHSQEKIDGIVGLIMALGRYMVTPEEQGSVYETRGVLTV